MTQASLLRRAALALKEGKTPAHDPADLLWDAANALERAHAQVTEHLSGLLKEPNGKRTTAEIALAENALAGASAPLPAEPSGLADLPDDAFLDFEEVEPEPSSPDTLDGAVLAAAHAIRAQNARRIAGLDPDPQHAIARAEALARLRYHLTRLDEDIETRA